MKLTSVYSLLALIAAMILPGCIDRKWTPPAEAAIPKQFDIYDRDSFIYLKGWERETAFDSLMNIWLTFSNRTSFMSNYMSSLYVAKRLEYDSAGSHPAAVLPFKIFSVFEYVTPKSHKLKSIEETTDYLSDAGKHFGDSRFDSLAGRLLARYDRCVDSMPDRFHPRRPGSNYYAHDVFEFDSLSHLDSIQLFALVNDSGAIAQLREYYTGNGHPVRMVYSYYLLGASGFDPDACQKSARLLWDNLPGHPSFAGSGLRMLQLGAEAGSPGCINKLNSLYTTD